MFSGRFRLRCGSFRASRCWVRCRAFLTSIDWLIVGGESGANSRPLNMHWVRDLRDRRGDTAFFFKQVGGLTPKAGGRLLDGRTWDEYPVVDREEVHV